jgi:hypothetical protein
MYYADTAVVLGAAAVIVSTSALAVIGWFVYTGIEAAPSGFPYARFLAASCHL